MHLPVLVKEVVEFLNCRPGRIYVDGTVGSGGHARAILERSSPTGRLIGLDWDGQALQRARQTLAPFGSRVELREENFKNLRLVLDSLSVPAVDGIVLDLGLSTDHLEDRERGFSFQLDAPLDMRMSQKTEVTARELLERLSADEIAGIFREFGEERWAARIARGIARLREVRPIRSTRDLIEVIERAVPGGRRGRIHPATRVFQALRIAVNDELNNLQSFLAEAEDLLNPEARLCVISFHSLEDRRVKQYFRQRGREEGGRIPAFRILTPKPVIPSMEEVSSNPRARSAKMRVAERLATEGEDNGRSRL